MRHRSLLALVLCLSLGMSFVQPTYASEHTLRQWIAPLECTQSNIVDGATETVILTPQECDDLLNPKPVTPVKPHTPGAPNTGYFKDPGPGMVVFVAVGALTVLMARRTRKV